MEDDINEPFLHYKDNEEDADLDKIIHKNIRNGFICKVYGIILYQIIISAIFVLFAINNSAFKKLLLTSYTLYFLSIFLSFFCILLPLCFPKIYQKVPINYIVITIFTLSISWTLAMVVCLYSVKSVIIAFFLTFITVLSLTVYAWRTEKDFTVYGGTLFVGLILLFFISIIYMIIPIRLIYLIYIYSSLILFCIYLIYDTQLLIGEGRCKFSEDDYILAAINIYLDIIILFLEILSIVGDKK